MRSRHKQANDRESRGRVVRLIDIVHQRAAGPLGAVLLLAIAGSVLLSFNAVESRWPQTTMPDLADTGVDIDTVSFVSEPSLINFWASWCVACRTDHTLLAELRGDIPVYGVNHLDQREDALRWLEYYGDPYVRSLFDTEGRIGKRLGIPALPVSLVVDRDGEIHYRHSGPLDSATVETIIRPLIEDLRRKQ
jgi:cytochrome c biogenesis protein CcmG/thiol:disulfide interchange protein DsbE